MTISEQAVADIVERLRKHGKVFDAMAEAHLRHHYEEIRAQGVKQVELANAFNAAADEIERLRAQPLLGVQRPEDVARVQEAFERQFPEYKRNGFTGGDRQDYETLKAAVLALPHTGQPQEGITEGAIEACAARLFGSEWDTKTNRTIARRALEVAEPFRKIGVILSAATSDETLYQTLVSPTPQAGCAKEGCRTCWVIENPDTSKSVYYLSLRASVPGFWTNDINLAMQFSRFDDADCYLSSQDTIDPNKPKIVEHTFPSPLPPVAESDKGPHDV